MNRGAILVVLISLVVSKCEDEGPVCKNRLCALLVSPNHVCVGGKCRKIECFPGLDDTLCEEEAGEDYECSETDSTSISNYLT